MNHRYFKVNSKESLKNKEKMICDLNSYIKQKKKSDTQLED